MFRVPWLPIARFIIDVVWKDDMRDRFMRKFKKVTGCEELDAVNAMICEVYGQRERYDGSWRGWL